MNLKHVVQQIKLLPGAKVDVGYRQERDAYLRQMSKRTGRDESDLLDASLQDDHDTISGIIRRCHPYQVPDDYISFLQNYGGLSIENDTSRLVVFGTGPMVEDWYSPVDSDEVLLGPARYGLLSIGSLRFKLTHKYKSQHVGFYLDIGAVIRVGSVIGVGPRGKIEPVLLQGLRQHVDTWQIIADSFTEWLNQAADTQGRFSFA